MKQLIWKLILPLTIISFTVISKWWYVLPGEDIPDIMMAGFPLPYVCDGWHTSMSLQIFVLELVIDLLVYFLFWSTLIFCIDRFLIKIRVHKIMVLLLLGIAGLFTSIFIFIGSFPEHLYYFKRPFEIEILSTGPKYIWNANMRPENFDFEAYKQRKKHNKQ